MPDGKWINFSVDGREVSAPENEWLVDAVKRGDVEVPFFCYEPKLGNPVGACRMCLVEIEGMPKLQTSCSTPVKDGMVVYTQTDRVKHAQNAVVEFLLVNHPLDCPVCDKGGECPLQDISYGWGAGRSRFVEPKRHFAKPIALSPLIAIDRERCILCYRCVRFSQEVAEDDQLAFLERADHTFVGTFDGRPYEAPFSGNIIELCPVGALTNTSYRFRARPWDIEDAGSICTLCPSQCNVAFTVRDEQVERVLARDNDDVDNGWLCDKGRWGYQSAAAPDRITQPLMRDGGHLRPVSWERALAAAVEGLRKAGAGTAALAGGGATNEEAYVLQRIVREALGSPHVDSRPGGPLEPATARMLAQPRLGAAVSDIDRASVVLVLESDPMHEAPILDLRLRKAVRRHGTALVVAGSRPTALDGGAAERLTCAPGSAQALLRALQKALVELEEESAVGSPQSAEKQAAGGGRQAAEEADGSATEIAGQAELASFLADHSLDRLVSLADTDIAAVREAARLLTDAENVVVIWGERLGHGDRGPEALRALRDLALLLGLDAAAGSGLVEIPTETNGRGLREMGFLPGLGPGFAVASAGMGAAQARGAANAGDVKAFYLLHADPMRTHPGSALWDDALGSAFVVAHEQFVTESLERHADVVFPAEAHPEKEGTVTHPDGRVQRLRPAVGHPGEVRGEWRVLVELARRLGLDLAHVSAGAVFTEIAERVAPYTGMTLDEIGGKGVRWPERDASVQAVSGILGDLAFDRPASLQGAALAKDGVLRLATAPSVWASWVTERSPSLHFMRTRQQLELNPLDADALGLSTGDRARVGANGSALEAIVRVRAAVKAGTALLTEGTAEDNATVVADGTQRTVEVRRVETRSAGAPSPPAAERA